MIPVGTMAGGSHGAGVPAPPPPAPAQPWSSSGKDADITLSGSDLVATLVSAGSQIGSIRSVTSHTNDGDFYAEVTVGGDDSNVLIGLVTISASLANYPGSDAFGRSYYGFDGQRFSGGSSSAYGASYAVGDLIGIRLNAGTLTFYKNGSSQGSAFTGLSGDYFIAWGPGTSGSGTRTASLNTGQTAFAFPPSGVTSWG